MNAPKANPVHVGQTLVDSNGGQHSPLWFPHNKVFLCSCGQWGCFRTIPAIGLQRLEEHVQKCCEALGASDAGSRHGVASTDLEALPRAEDDKQPCEGQGAPRC